MLETLKRQERYVLTRIMKQARHTFAICCGIAGASLAAASIFSAEGLAPEGKDGKATKKKDAVAVALDTIEQQLQRRFHDRQNISFGMERVVRAGARMHNSTVLDLLSMRSQLIRDDGTEAPRRTEGGVLEFEIAPGKWVRGSDLKQTMHSENEDEKQAIVALAKSDVAIYTAGLFDSTSGIPSRLKGPAYLRLTANDAPAKETLTPLAAKGWASSNEADELRKDGWTFRVVKVKADDQSCINCHASQTEWRGGGGQKITVKPYKVGEPLGVFVIASRMK
jgi:hypothetical protein